MDGQPVIGSKYEFGFLKQAVAQTASQSSSEELTGESFFKVRSNLILVSGGNRYQSC